MPSPGLWRPTPALAPTACGLKTEWARLRARIQGVRWCLQTLPFTLSLSKGRGAVHGSTSSPRTVSDDLLDTFFGPRRPRRRPRAVSNRMSELRVPFGHRRKRGGLEATGGFEPPNRGFADLRLSPLGYVAQSRVAVRCNPNCIPKPIPGEYPPGVTCLSARGFGLSLPRA